MKTLLLVRHAKSSWDNSSLNDFDRPLNERGQRDAPVMAKRLLDRKIAIDAFVSSPAKRAKKTAELFIKEFGAKKDAIIFHEDLYGAIPENFYKVIGDVDNNYESIALFSHNPGITDFASGLTNARIDEMPTCAIFAVKIHTDKWSEFETAAKEFWFFDYPKSDTG